jgi:putative sterol carrier protein
VARFLSPAWTEEFNKSVEDVVVPGPGPDAGLGAIEGRFTVVQEVRGTPDGDVSLILRVDGGSLQLDLAPMSGDDGHHSGDRFDADVTIAVSYGDAAAMSKGELSPAEALNTGRIRVRGDLSVLVAAQQMFETARVATQAKVSPTTY